jgi:TolC family type I secretion outer membrane protein
MKLKRYAFLLFTFLMLAFGAALPEIGFAQSHKLSLADAVATALDKSRDLDVARLEKERTDQRVREAWGGALPTLSASGQYTRNIKKQVLFLPGAFIGEPQVASVAFPIGSNNAYAGTLSLTQTLFNGQTFAGIRAAKIVDALSEESFISSRATVITDVKKAYYNVLIAIEQLKLQQQSLARNEDALSDTRKLFKQGLAADLDTLRAFVQVENLRPQLIKYISGVEIAKTQLKTKMGIDSNEDLDLTDSLVFDGIIPETRYEAVYSQAIAQRPEVRQLDLTVKADEEQINADFSGHLPTLSAIGNLSIQAQDDSFKFSQYVWPVSSSVGLSLSVPIFAGFKTDAKVQQSKIVKRQDEKRLDNTREQIRSEIKTVITSVDEARKRIAVQERTVQAAQRSYDITKSRRQQGLGSQLDLTDAELSLNQAKVNYIQAVYDFLVAKADLDKATGRVGRL